MRWGRLAVSDILDHRVRVAVWVALNVAVLFGALHGHDIVLAAQPSSYRLRDSTYIHAKLLYLEDCSVADYFAFDADRDILQSGFYIQVIDGGLDVQMWGDDDWYMEVHFDDASKEQKFICLVVDPVRVKERTFSGGGIEAVTRFTITPSGTLLWEPLGAWCPDDPDQNVAVEYRSLDDEVPDGARKENGRELQEYCRVMLEQAADLPRPFRGGLCGGFLLGSHEMYQLVMSNASVGELGSQASPLTPYYAPADISFPQLAVVTVKFLEAHPERLRETATVLFVSVMRETFPAPRRQRGAS